MSVVNNCERAYVECYYLVDSSQHKPPGAGRQFKENNCKQTNFVTEKIIILLHCTADKTVSHLRIIGCDT